MLHFGWRSRALFQWAGLWVFGVWVMCVSGSVIGGCVVRRKCLWCWLGVRLIGLCVLMWQSFGRCACVLFVRYVFDALRVPYCLGIAYFATFVVFGKWIGCACEAGRRGMGVFV